MCAFLFALLKDESGATSIEYGLIASLVSVAAIGAFMEMGTSVSTMFGSVANKLQQVSFGAGS